MENLNSFDANKCHEIAILYKKLYDKKLEDEESLNIIKDYLTSNTLEFFNITMYLVLTDPEANCEYISDFFRYVSFEFYNIPSYYLILIIILLRNSNYEVSMNAVEILDYLEDEKASLHILKSIGSDFNNCENTWIRELISTIESNIADGDE